jgi:hypothetical protein
MYIIFFTKIDFRRCGGSLLNTDRASMHAVYHSDLFPERKYVLSKEYRHMARIE